MSIHDEQSDRDIRILQQSWKASAFLELDMIQVLPFIGIRNCRGFFQSFECTLFEGNKQLGESEAQSFQNFLASKIMQEMRSTCGLIKIRLTSPQPICHIRVQDKFYLKTPWGVGV